MRKSRNPIGVDKINKDLVSFIIPTCNRYEVCLQNIKNIKQQSYQKHEIIICDDSDKKYYLDNSKKFQNELENLNVKYKYCARFDSDGKKDYGLARARNFGVIESQGEFLVFLDDRITPNGADSILNLIKPLRASEKKLWVFGDKGANKSSFVENFSAIRRNQMVSAGMFCERIDQYGGMTRELSTRYSSQGFIFQYVPEAKAKEVCRSGGWDEKPKQISAMNLLLDKLLQRKWLY